MASWWIDRVLPGAVVSIPLFVGGLWVQGRRLRSHVERVTDKQTAAFQGQLDDQTQQLRKGRERG